MSKQSIDELMDNWEHEVTGTPQHWEKTQNRIAIDNKFKAALLEAIKGAKPKNEWDKAPDTYYGFEDGTNEYEQNLIDLFGGTSE